MATRAPHPIRGHIGDHGAWRIVHTRANYYCYVEGCPAKANWKALIGAEDFNGGRTCNEHWPTLVRIAKSMADGWQPAPPYYHC